jgi:hypothetical protein
VSTEAEPEENEFTLEGLVASRGTTSAARAAPKAAHKRGELFARITERHSALLAGVKGVHPVILFHYLMMYSVKAFHRPFELPVEYLTRKTGMDRRQQLRAVRNLVEIRIIKTGRGGRYDLPLITIPGTTKNGRKTT